MSKSAFKTYFKNEFPYAKKMKTKTGVCDLCCKFKRVLNDQKMDQESKEFALVEYKSHKQDHTEARSYYVAHKSIRAKEIGYFALPFDYAENILLPRKIIQPATFYFKTKKKIDLFGINNECTDLQWNFLIDENFKIKKGPDSVISMIDFYINSNIPYSSNLILFSDRYEY